MSVYLLDENVLKEIGPGGDANVHAWLKNVDDSELRVSAITFLEKRRGWERQRRKLAAAGKDCSAVDDKLKELDAFEEAYGDREIPIDRRVAREWARLLGAKDKNQRDMALAATARVHSLVLVTRNVKDFGGRGVRLLNPFDPTPHMVEPESDEEW